VSAPVKRPAAQRVNLTLTRAVYEHAAASGNASKALEDAYRAQHGLGPRPPLAKGGRPRRRPASAPPEQKRP